MIVDEGMRVAITGLGALTAAGTGAGAIANQLADSEVLYSDVDSPPGSRGSERRRVAAVVGSPDLKRWLSPAAARRMSRPSKFAVVAAKLAVEHSGLSHDSLAPESVAVVVATSFGPTDFSERIVRGLYEDGPEGTSPSLFTESVANAPAAQVALTLGATGPNLTITQREAGPLMALATAAREIASGRSQVVLVGSVDEVMPILHSSLERFGALAGSRGQDPTLARPFEARRDGFLLAEGACMLVLESEKHARSRGARIIARVRQSISGFDPDAPSSSWARRPEPLARRLAAGLEAASVDLTGFNRVVSGASGSRPGDRLEALVLQAVWGDLPLPPVLAPKGVVGEYGGGFLAAAVLAASGAPFGPTPGFARLDSKFGLAPHDGSDLAPPSRVLVSSLAAGGAAAWTILESGDP